MQIEADWYEGQEQTFAKHRTLECYLEKLAFKIGGFQDGLTLNYVDGFAGPWNSTKKDLSDTSPVIAIEQLRQVRDALKQRPNPRTLNIRGFFVSKEPAQAELLTAALARFPDVETKVVTGEFEANIDRARAFIRGKNPFGFVFIDPTGWTGFSLDRIAPLLREVRSEVLLNFMLGHVSRFIDDDDSTAQPGFIDLFGDETARDAWRGLTRWDRDDKIVETYCARLGDRAGYLHCVSSLILNPTKNRAHYHLVYGTKSDAGLVAFRESERATLDDYLGAVRTSARERAATLREQKKTGRAPGTQLSLLAPQEMGLSTFETNLLARYRARAIARIEATLAAKRRASWRDLLCDALHVPMVCEKDVKAWLAAQQKAGRLTLDGLAPTRNVPQVTDRAVFVRLL